MSPLNRLFWNVDGQWVLDSGVPQRIADQSPVRVTPRKPINPWLVGAEVGDAIAAVVYGEKAGGR